MGDYSDPPDELVDRLRPICLALPDAYEEKAWAGTRWMVRKKTFAHILEVDRFSPPILTRRSRADRRRHGRDLPIPGRGAGGAPQRPAAPFFYAGRGRDVIGLVLDDDTDWDEVGRADDRQLLRDGAPSWSRQVDRPPQPD